MAHQDELERVALAIEATMFAPHELPLPPELHAKYLETAKAAIAAQQDGARQPIETAPQMTEEIINAIIAGIGSDDDPTQQALAIVDNLGRHGYVIAAQQDGVREVRNDLNKFGKEGVRRVVRTVLDRGIWPEYRSQDDPGLTEGDYTNFVIEVMAEVLRVLEQ